MLVIQGGLNPKYVLDEMQMYELQPLIDNIYLKNRESWEQTRLLGYIIAQGHSTQRITMTDILKFPWDENEKNDAENTDISNEDVERLRMEANKYLNNKK